MVEENRLGNAGERIRQAESGDHGQQGSAAGDASSGGILGGEEIEAENSAANDAEFGAENGTEGRKK